MTTSYLLPLDSPSATLALAGGKGANLARLIQGGFPVPTGFIVTTAAYDAFLEANGLRPCLAAALAGVAADDLAAGSPAVLNQASETIRTRFRASPIPAAIAGPVRAAYAERFGADGPVAVRSSATAEDLPDLSFAGQQDTFLNVSGPDALLDAIRACWGSLWTARAIGYRARNAIPQAGVSLAVVVQAMVQAEAAGVLFTANPLSGRRIESAIDATLGLGEALVSGQVEPDHYLVDAAGSRIVDKRLGAKTTAGEAGDRRSVQALPDAAILELAGLGERVEAYFGGPQDIEWTWAGGALSLVQSRPITSLYPLPEGMDASGPLRVLGSFGAVQGMLDPLTPLGCDALRSLAASTARMLDYDATWESQGVFKPAGQRLWIDLTGLLRNGFGRRLLHAALGQVEPSVREALLQVWDDPRLSATAERPSPHAVRLFASILLPLAGRLALALARPEAAQRDAAKSVGQAIAWYEARVRAAASLDQRLALLDEIAVSIRKFLLPGLFPRFVPGMASLYRLYRVCDGLPAGRPLALELLRGLPNNVTTEMDLALWEAARRIQGDEAAHSAFTTLDSGTLAQAYLAKGLPPVGQRALAEFLSRYGMRGLGEIDIGRPRWRDDPAPVMEAVQSYVRITDPALAPDAVFARGAAAAGRANERLDAELRKLPGGRRKAALARWYVRRVRALAGLRESPKFTIVNLLGLAREALLASGAELAAAGVLDAQDEIFWLPRSELQALAGAQARGVDLAGWRRRLCAGVAAQRERYAREQRRRQVPRLMLSDGTAFYEGIGGAEAQADRSGGLVGSPVSPGVAEGRVNVVFDPGKAKMEPGDVLVCRGTDPSWTPLFLPACALVMEVGGMMTHGSVVAREYGIPAVVGVDRVTSRLHTGQRVRVDGTKGIVVVLDEAGG